jgi:hypothetical protein
MHTTWYCWTIASVVSVAKIIGVCWGTDYSDRIRWQWEIKWPRKTALTTYPVRVYLLTVGELRIIRLIRYEWQILICSAADCGQRLVSSVRDWKWRTRAIYNGDQNRTFDGLLQFLEIDDGTRRRGHITVNISLNKKKQNKAGEEWKIYTGRIYKQNRDRQKHGKYTNNQKVNTAIDERGGRKQKKEGAEEVKKEICCTKVRK